MPVRYHVATPKQSRASNANGDPPNTSDMAFRVNPLKPTAKVLITASSHEKLNQILLTLSAVASAQDQPSRQRTTGYAATNPR
ncbi:MAG: hypothetical protein JO061_11255 [Acidobacteriaceae bacterium]|nr:hypothetical protein [Acidobacteriaceae bacterium]